MLLGIIFVFISLYCSSVLLYSFYFCVLYLSVCSFVSCICVSWHSLFSFMFFMFLFMFLLFFNKSALGSIVGRFWGRRWVNLGSISELGDDFWSPGWRGDDFWSPFGAPESPKIGKHRYKIVFKKRILILI